MHELTVGTLEGVQQGFRVSSRVGIQYSESFFPLTKYCLSLDFQLILFQDMWGHTRFVWTLCNQRKDVGDSGCMCSWYEVGSMSMACA